MECRSIFNAPALLGITHLKGAALRNTKKWTPEPLQENKIYTAKEMPKTENEAKTEKH